MGDRSQPEAIGFPMQIWHSRDYPYVYSWDNPGFLPNLGFALVLCVGCGLLAAKYATPIDRLIGVYEPAERKEKRFQFSIRGLLVFTLTAAVGAFCARWLASTPYALAGIYVFGPVGLIVVAMVPGGLRWQQRIGILGPGAVSLIILALVVGMRLGVEVDKILLGIYVCWTPQSFVAALALTAGILIQHRAVLVARHST